MPVQRATQTSGKTTDFTSSFTNQTAQPLTLPVNMVLNTVGLDIMNLQDPKKEKSNGGYELSLRDYTPDLIQKLLVQNCLNRIDISLDDIRASRRDILDFTKLIMFSVLYKQFRKEVFEMTVNSPLIIQWNRQNPRKQIDSHSDQSLMRMEGALSSRNEEIKLFRQNMMNKLWKDHGYLFNGDDDHQKRMGMAGKLLAIIHPFTQTVILDYWKMQDVKILTANILNRIALYLKRYSLPEFNALVLLEYLQCSERENLIAQYRKIMESSGKKLSEFPMNEMIREELIRRKISPQTRFSFLFENRSSQSKGIISRMRTIILSGEREIRRVNDILFNRTSALRLKKSIKDYLMKDENSAGESFNPEVLHYYLNHLEEECRKTQCGFTSFVNYDSDNSVSVTHLIFDC